MNAFINSFIQLKCWGPVVSGAVLDIQDTMIEIDGAHLGKMSMELSLGKNVFSVISGSQKEIVHQIVPIKRDGGHWWPQ